MDKSVRQKELLSARSAIQKAGLYLVQKKDIERVAEVAADSFLDYPLYNWFSGGKCDATATKLIMQTDLRTMTEDAVIYADSEEINGFAVWIPRGFTGSKTVPFLLNGGIKLFFHSGVGILGRLIAYESYAMKQKKEFTDHNDWYLHNISVKREAQGKGIAGKLLRPMLQLCDDQRTVAYLETNAEGNVGFYRHFGFELMRDECIPKTSVNHYAMVRRPIEE